LTIDVIVAFGVGVDVLVDVAADVVPTDHGAVPHPLIATTSADPSATVATVFFQPVRTMRHSPMPPRCTARHEVRES
jgi:hypothetical protein